MSKRRQISPRNIMPDELLPKRRPAMDGVVRSSAALERNRGRVPPAPPDLTQREIAPPPQPRVSRPSVAPSDDYSRPSREPTHAGRFAGYGRKGTFGFIQPAGGGNPILVTRSALAWAGIAVTIEPGDRLRYNTRPNDVDGRPIAIDVEAVDNTLVLQ